MSRGYKELIKILAEHLIDIPMAVAFHADEAMLKEYSNLISIRTINPEQTSFNDFCRDKILQLQPAIQTFERELTAFNQSSRKSAYELTFEEFISTREVANKEKLIELFYITVRFKEYYATEKHDQMLESHELSDKTIEWIVNNYVKQNMPSHGALKDRARRIFGYTETSLSEFKQKVRVEKLPELIKQFKQKRADEIYDSIMNKANIILEKEYLASLKQVNLSSILVANLSNLTIGENFADAMPDAALLNPRSMMYGDNYHKIDLGSAMKQLNLSGSVLKKCHFSGIDMSGIILRDTSLEGVRMDDCRLVGADMRGADTARLAVNYAFRSDFVLPEGITKDQYIASMFNAVKISSHGIYFVNRKMLACDLESGAVTRDNITPTNVRMDGRSIREFEIMHGSSDYSDEANEVLCSAFIIDPVYERCSDAAVKTKHQVKLIDLESFLKCLETGEYEKECSFNQYINNIYARPGESLYASLEEIDLSSLGSKLCGINFSYCDLHNANLNRLDLSNVNFEGANLENADLSKAKLFGANLSYANAACAKFIGADFGQDASLVGTILDFADMSGADVSGVNLSDCLGRYLNLSEVMGKKLIARNANLQGMSAINADFTQAIFAKTNLSRANLTDAVLTGADLRDTVANNMIAVRANFEEALMQKIEARKVNFTSAVLKKANLRDSIISGSILDSADFEDADLSHSIARDIVSAMGTNFKKAVLDDIDFKFSNLEGAILEEARGHRADLRFAILRHVKAMRADFTQSIMRDLDASYADFTHSTLERAQLDYSRFVETTMREANLRMTEARETDFAKADLTKADTTGMIISSGTNLRGTILTEAIGADHLIAQQKLQETSLISEIFGKFIKNALIGALVLTSIYLLPCCALGYGVSLYCTILLCSMGALAGIISEPLYHAGKLILKLGKFFRELSFERIKTFASEKMHDLAFTMGSVYVEYILTGSQRVDLEEIAGENHLQHLTDDLREEVHRRKSYICNSLDMKPEPFELEATRHLDRYQRVSTIEAIIQKGPSPIKAKFADRFNGDHSTSFSDRKLSDEAMLVVAGI